MRTLLLPATLLFVLSAQAHDAPEPSPARLDMTEFGEHSASLYQKELEEFGLDTIEFHDRSATSRGKDYELVDPIGLRRAIALAQRSRELGYQVTDPRRLGLQRAFMRIEYRRLLERRAESEKERTKAKMLNFQDDLDILEP